MLILAPSEKRFLDKCVDRIWPQASDRPRPSGTAKATTLTFLSFTLLDTFVILLAVFAWVYLRANVALLDAVSSWTISDPDDPRRPFIFALQDTACGYVSALLLARPLVRSFGEQAVKAACVVATPYGIYTCTDTAFDLFFWMEHPLGACLWLFTAVIAALLLMQRCSRLTLLNGPGTQCDADGTWMSRIRTRRPELRPAALAVVLFISAAVLVTHHSMDLPEEVIHVIPAAEAAWEMSWLLVTACLTVATIALVRALRTKDLRLGRWQVYGRGSEWATTMAVLGIPWILTLLHAAPVIGDGVLDTVEYAPGVSVSRWSISYDEHTHTLRLSGTYQPGVAAAFEAELTAHPNVEAVELEGPGGRLGEGFRIAELIETRGLSTVVRNRCASACVFAFAGGKERIVAPDARLGFHAGRSPSVLENWLYDTEVEDAFLRERGFKDEFIDAANAVPNEDAWYPSHEKLLAAGVITAVQSKT